METKARFVYEDGKWWYVGPSGSRRSKESHVKKNRNRMYVAGKYVPKSHPRHKPGTYESFEHAWSHKELDSASAGEVYMMSNPAWDGWLKVGMAVDAEDRVRSYQTSSPFRDFDLIMSVCSDNKRETERVAHKLLERVCDDRRGEWFKIDPDVAEVIFLQLET